MRYGIISDIHGNTEGLEACLNELEAQGIDRLVCLGDIVGYGAEPNECCDIIREKADITILGNHDAVLVGKLDEEYCHSAARRALRYSAEQLSDTNYDFLASLKYKTYEDDSCFCHGSPINAEDFEYVFSLDQAATLTAHFSSLSKVTFVGHSHVTTAYLVTPAMSLQMSAPRLQLRDGVKYVFNVGSVGQPRDNDPRACCVIYDTDEQSVSYFRVEYDIEAAADKIFAAELPQAFGQRLFHGV
ncbi:MAG TPA: metallophosphoesterase [Myxococcales bacterium]|nr:metallophosphoesterase [Myxococcales bacterium]HIN86782.1 metallophosphoesterase [Myxococcales bacterium]